MTRFTAAGAVTVATVSDPNKHHTRSGLFTDTSEHIRFFPFWFFCFSTFCSSWFRAVD